MPKATAKRLPVYLCCLEMLRDSGVKHIRSREFSEMIRVPSATIWHDSSHVGELGRGGYDYDVSHSIEVFSSVSNTQKEKGITLIGCGNLGRALLKNDFRHNKNLNVACTSGNDSVLVGTTINGLLVRDMSELKAFVRQKGVTVAISTMSNHHAQEAIDKIVQAGVTVILNFTSDHVSMSADVSMQYIDLTAGL